MPEGDKSLRVTFLTHYFPPEVGAPQARLFELARRLVDSGIDVTVVTGFPNYPSGVIFPGYRGRFTMEERLDGVRVLRTPVFATPNRGFVRRILNHLSFAFSSLLALRRAGSTDVIFVESPPLLIGLGALVFAWLDRAPYIFNVSDIWPQSAVELGALRNRFAIRLAEALELHLYRSAARVSAVTPGMIERLVARGVPREKLFLLTNGVDTSIYAPAAPDRDLALRLGSSSVRIEAPVPGRRMMGIEVPNQSVSLVTLREVMDSTTTERAKAVGALIARKAKDKGITRVVFDRGGYQYHGNIKALADAARENGLEF